MVLCQAACQGVWEWLKWLELPNGHSPQLSPDLQECSLPASSFLTKGIGLGRRWGSGHVFQPSSHLLCSLNSVPTLGGVSMPLHNSLVKPHVLLCRQVLQAGWVLQMSFGGVLMRGARAQQHPLVMDPAVCAVSSATYGSQQQEM